MATDEGTEEEETAASSGGAWKLTPIAFLLAVISLAWWLPRLGSQGGELAVPRVTSQASNLAPDERAQLSAELEIHLETLDRVEQQIVSWEKNPLRSAVPPARAKEIVRLLADVEDLVHNPSASGLQLREARHQIHDLWTERFSSLQDFLDESRGPSDLPVLPPLNVGLLSSLYGDSRADLYRSRHQDLSARLARLTVLRSQAYDADVAGRVERLSKVLAVRYELLSELSRRGAMLSLENPRAWWEDVSLELRTYPLRKRGIFLVTMAQLEQRTGGGTAWVMGLTMQIGRSLLAFLLLLLSIFQVARKSAQRPPSLGGMLSWISVWGLSWLCYSLVAGTVADALRPLTSLLGWYAVYRAYGQLAQGQLVSALSASPVGQVVGVRTRALRDLQLVGKMILLQGVVTTLAVGLAGPGLLLTSSHVIFGLFFKFLYLALAWRWRLELGQTLSRQLPRPVGPFLEGLCRSSLLAVFVAPLVVPLVAMMWVVRALVRWSLRFEWGKSLSAGVLRRWIESSQDKQGPEFAQLPGDYREKFSALKVDPMPWWDESAPEFRSSLVTAVEEWMGGEAAESCLMVHGPLGSGRSDMQAYLAGTFADRLQVVNFCIEERIHTEEALLRVLSQSFQIEGAADFDELTRQLLERPPTLAIVCHLNRVFLACVGGFAALRAFGKLMARCRQRIFWCLTLTTQSLRYLKMVVPDFSTFPLTVQMPRWSEKSIEGFLLARHSCTGYKFRLSQAVLRAAEATPGASAEGHYFHVLTDLCKGNPSVAQDLFLESARIDEEGTVVLGLPRRNPVKKMSTLPTTSIYLLSSVLRHGDLTFGAAAESAGLTPNQLYVAWERCVELGILHQSDAQRVHVSRRWIADVARVLQERNLLDGE